jgi:hypothetical protein
MAHQQGDFAKNHAEHARLLRPQRHADADFIAPAGDVVGHHAIQPDRRQGQRQYSEKSGERGQQPLARQRFLHLERQRLELQRGVAIDFRDGRFRPGDHCGGRPAARNSKS